MKRYEHVIWDWNGTLLDDVALCVDVVNVMLRERAMHELDTVRYRQIFGFPVRAYYQTLGFNFLTEPFEELASEYCAEYDSRVAECSLHTDAIAALNAVAEQGIAQSILSAHEQRSLSATLRHFSVDEYFDEVVGLSDRYAAGKVDAGRALIGRLGIAPSRTVLIGDTAHDHEVASALGVACLLVSNGHHSKQRLEAVHDDVIESLAAVVSRTAYRRA